MTAVTVRLAGGDGWLARRSDGLLYLDAAWDDAVTAFTGAADGPAGRDAVTAAAAAADLDVPGFVVVTWSDRVECVVFGAIEVRTDDPSAPVLNASGAGTWIERRLAGANGPITVTGGQPVAPVSRLEAGVVPAGGFEVVTAPAGHAAADLAETTIRPGQLAEVAGSTTVAQQAGMESLADVVGDDWMEESLGLGGPPRSERIAAEAEAAAENGDPVDAESTWIPGDETAAATSAAIPEPPVEAPPSPGGAADPDWMNRPPDPGRQAAAPQPLVQVRRCLAGHLNPPQASLCRTCGEVIDPSSEIETTRQPSLARAVLPDDSSVAIDGTLVIGRNPDGRAARAGDDVRLVKLSASTAVSRTHVAVRADEWSLTVTDCGSRGGVVVVTPGHEPVMLEPWIPQEVSVGDTIYLGGPTSVRIDPVE